MKSSIKVYRTWNIDGSVDIVVKDKAMRAKFPNFNQASWASNAHNAGVTMCQTIHRQTLPKGTGKKEVGEVMKTLKLAYELKKETT